MTDYKKPQDKSIVDSEKNSVEQPGADDINEETLAFGEEIDTQPADPIDDVDTTYNMPGSEALVSDVEADLAPDDDVTQDDALALGEEIDTQPANPLADNTFAVIEANTSETYMDTETVSESPNDDNLTNGSSATRPEVDVQSYEAGTTPNTDGTVSEVTASKPHDPIVYPSSSINGASEMEANKSKDSLEEYQILPDASWPPPMFIKRNITPQERYYLEQRWHSQWRFFDKKANDSKRLYLRLQRIIVIGSVTVPVLVSLDPDILAGALNTLVGVVNLIPQLTIPAADSAFSGLLIDASTVVLSLAVAIAAGLESLNKYGDNWGSYRQAAEELQAEKSFYDVAGGRYANNPDAFGRFVERTEEIIAQQNGRFIASVEKQTQESEKRGSEFLGTEEEDSDSVDSLVSPEPAYQETSVG